MCNIQFLWRFHIRTNWRLWKSAGVGRLGRKDSRRVRSLTRTCSRGCLGSLLGIRYRFDRLGVVLFVCQVVAAARQNRTHGLSHTKTRLVLFMPRLLDFSIEPESSDTAMGLDAFEGVTSIAFSRGALCCFWSDISMYFSRSSPTLAFRKEAGIRFIRNSIRVRRLCACRAY